MPLSTRNGPGLAYDPVSDRVVGWAGGAVYSLDPQTRAWTTHNVPGAPMPTQNGIYGRWQYVAAVNAFILVTSVDENVHFFKLTAGAPDAGGGAGGGSGGTEGGSGGAGPRNLRVGCGCEAGGPLLTVALALQLGRRARRRVKSLAERWSMSIPTQ